MHLRMWYSGWTMFLCYLYELFMLFLLTIYAIKKQNNNLRLASHVGGWLLDREFD
jgi:hypothetical protein